MTLPILGPEDRGNPGTKDEGEPHPPDQVYDNVGTTTTVV